MEAVTVELRFPLRGEALAVDHGWALYGAISHLCAPVHEEPQVRVGPVEGALFSGKGRLRLTPQSALPLRLPQALVRHVYPLAGKALDVDGDRVALGIPRIRLLTPCDQLNARIVSVANRTDWPALTEELLRQLDALGVRAEITPGRRRVMRVKQFKNIGFAVGLSGLSEEDSLKLQAVGVGGRRAFGGGFFVHGPLPEGALATPEDLEVRA